jgi:acetoin utilization deacetylase AcuC-like enzyme
MIEQVLAVIPEEGSGYDYGQIDADTFVSPGSLEAALRACGAVIKGVDLVMAGEARNAFCAVRPPGHHAEPTRAMGFCLFNNVAVGALHARNRYGLQRIAVLDFDVHHGNGTQAAFELDPGLMLVSSHQSPLYPGTGSANEHGLYDNIVNLPLRPGSGSSEFRNAMTQRGLPALERFAPELLLISAGFDAHQRDPLANLRLDEADFSWITREAMGIAQGSAKGRIVSTLEGGYDLVALAGSAAAHVAALMNRMD